MPGKRNVEIIGVEPVGNYAVRLVFDDMHDTGIYGWDYLFELGSGQAERWQAYLAELAAKGLSRSTERRTDGRPGRARVEPRDSITNGANSGVAPFVSRSRTVEV